MTQNLAVCLHLQRPYVVFSEQDIEDINNALDMYFDQPESSGESPPNSSLTTSATSMTANFVTTSTLTEEETTGSQDDAGPIIENGCSRDLHGAAGRAHMWINFSVFFLLPILVSLKNQFQVELKNIFLYIALMNSYEKLYFF